MDKSRIYGHAGFIFLLNLFHIEWQISLSEDGRGVVMMAEQQATENGLWLLSTIDYRSWLSSLEIVLFQKS